MISHTLNSPGNTLETGLNTYDNLILLGTYNYSDGARVAMTVEEVYKLIAELSRLTRKVTEKGAKLRG